MRTWMWIAFLGFALGVSSSAHATLLVVRPLADLVVDAEHIVVVTCLGETSRWDRFGRIVSDMRLRVDDVVKGRSRRGEEIRVTRLGGAIGDVGMTVAGEAHLAAGERAVLLLDEMGDQGALRVADMALGQFPVVMQDGVLTALPSGGGLALVARDDDGALSPSVAPMQAPLALADFLMVLRDLTRSR